MGEPFCYGCPDHEACATGTPCTDEELEDRNWAHDVIYDKLHFCGCGMFTARMELLKQVLEATPMYEGRWPERDTVLGEAFLCLLDGAGLTEHGGSVGGSWLTDDGERMLRILQNERAWTALVDY